MPKTFPSKASTRFRRAHAEGLNADSVPQPCEPAPSNACVVRGVLGISLPGVVLHRSQICALVGKIVATGLPERWLPGPQSVTGFVFGHLQDWAGQDTVGEPELIQNRVVIRFGDRNQIARKMGLRPVGMVSTTASDHRWQLAGAVCNGQWFVGQLRLLTGKTADVVDSLPVQLRLTLGAE
jgi:hypothetical protein